MTKPSTAVDAELVALRKRVAELESAQAQQQAELATLQASSHRLHTILERSPIVLFETDRDSHFSFVEGKGLERLGITGEQLLGRPSMQLYGQLPGVAERRARVMTGESTEFTLPVREDAIFRIWTAPSRNAAGEIVGTYGVAIDTTAQSLAEQQLKQREEFFHMLTSVSPTGLYQVTGHAVDYANERAMEIAGLPPGDLSPEAWANVLHPDDRERVTQEWLDTIQQKRRFVSEYRFLRPDGQTLHVQGEAVPRLDAQGNVIGAVGTITDISGIKQVETQLKRHHDWLESIAATVPGAIAVYNIRTLRYSFVSDGFRELLGCDPRELLEGNFDWIASRTHAEDFERVMGESRQAVADDDALPRELRRNMVIGFEYRMRHADGSWRWVRTIGTVFSRDEEGRIAEVLNVTLDITDRHEMEDRLREAQSELERRVGERTAELGRINASLRREIDQRETSELELRNNNRVLRTVYDTMSDGVQIVNVEQRLVMTNRAGDRILNLHQPRQSWRFDGRAFETDQATAIARADLPHARALRGEAVRNFDLYLAPNEHMPEGAWLNVNADPLHNDHGQVTGAVIIFRDDTARRRALDALRQSLDRFNLMVDGSKVGLWDALVNVDDPLNPENPLYYSPHMTRLLGYEPAEFGTKLSAWANHVHPDDQPRVFAALMAHMNENVPYDIEYRCYTKQRELRWFAARGDSIRDEHNRTIRLSGSFIDITARKLAEQELAQKEGLLRIMMDTTSAVVYIKDLDGRYLYINHEFEKLFNVTREQHIGRSDFDLFPHDVAEAFRCNDQQVAQAADPVQFEEYAPRDDGMHTYLSVKFAIRNWSGDVYATCGISTDITERKRSEARLIEDQRFLRGLIAVNERERQTMAYNLHDGLIQYITGSVMEIEGLTKTIQLNDEQRSRFDNVLRSLRQAINDGRRVLSGLRPLVLDASGVVIALEHLLAELRANTTIDLSLTQRVDFDRLPPLVEEMIYRIVQESLNNVIKHSGAKWAGVVLYQMGDNVRITVRDDGHGFDLRQVNPRRYGLQGIRKRAELIGGTAEIESSPGHGTVVSVTLPLTLRELSGPA
ncbi:MAG: PAS domain-containing protein [Planctomycetaceae bacterium]|nr:PAS domain-containing protein [Planctomycetaceae bacterium]